jgi:hypothetical protein
LPLFVIAKKHGRTKTRITQIADMFLRMCMHPSRYRQVRARQKALDNSTINT